MSRFWANVNWPDMGKRNETVWNDLPKGLADALNDDSVSVTCQILQDLGINPVQDLMVDLSSEMSTNFSNARAAIQTFVEISLLRMGMFSGGESFACSHPYCEFDYIPLRGWRGPNDSVLSDHEHYWKKET